MSGKKHIQRFRIAKNIDKEELNIRDGDFELINEDKHTWEAAHFWEKDAMQNEAICRICLCVDWQTKTSKVETFMRTNSMRGEVYYGLCSEYPIPYDTDFTQFPDFYDTEVRPLLRQLNEGVSIEWSNSNWIGVFNCNVRHLDWDVENKLHDTPTHDLQHYFNIIDLYDGSKSWLVSDLLADGIDLKTADLDNEVVMSLAVEKLSLGDGTDYKLIEVNIERELREIQSELQEE
jgi:hypothetical protein